MKKALALLVFALGLLVTAAPAHAQTTNPKSITWTFTNNLPAGSIACPAGTTKSCVLQYVFSSSQASSLIPSITVSALPASGTTPISSYTETAPTAWASYSFFDTVTMQYYDATGTLQSLTSADSNTLTFTVAPLAPTGLTGTLVAQ